MSAERLAEKGSRIELDIEKLSYGGRGIGRLEGLTVFVDQVSPGERVAARVFRRKKNHAEARLLEVLRPSPRRRNPPCPLFGQCGGCTWQHIAYEEQLAAKQEIVRESIEHIGGLRDIPIRPIVPSPRPWHYRNKMEFTFGSDERGNLCCGFHEPERWQNVLDVRRCWLHPEAFNEVLEQTRAWAVRHHLDAHDPRSHSGYLRHLVIRGSEADGGILALLLTGNSEDRGITDLHDVLRRSCPSLAGFLWGVNSSLSDVARPDKILRTWGETALTDRIGNLEFRISSTSFFQTNTLGAGRLYEVARQALELDGTQTLLDAYCGTGTVGIFCADACREVWGLELLKEAVWDARENAARNSIANARFLAGDIKVTLPLLLGGPIGRVDRLVVDPPRGGMEKKALAHLLALRAPILVYISCNPTTLGRDLQVITESGYAVECITPVDMFPQTYHIEAVAQCRLLAV